MDDAAQVSNCGSALKAVCADLGYGEVHGCTCLQGTPLADTIVGTPGCDCKLPSSVLNPFYEVEVSPLSRALQASSVWAGTMCCMACWYSLLFISGIIREYVTEKHDCWPQGNDLIFAGDGADTLYGGGGADILYGQEGPDLLLGEGGKDSMFGGQESDVLYGGNDSDLVHGNDGPDLLYGNAGADTLYGGTPVPVPGRRQPRRALLTFRALRIGAGIDTIYGGLGPDRIFGGRGPDVLLGNDGADSLEGDEVGAPSTLMLEQRQPMP